MKWDPVLQNFKIVWADLVSTAEEVRQPTPKISRTLPILKWSEAFQIFLHKTLGRRHAPLAYVIRKDVVPAQPLPALDPDQPFSVEHGNVEKELIALATHRHGLYQKDNAMLFYLLEEATRGTGYAITLKPFQRREDGRS
eukprot:scaffold8121_cov97-Cylindrotheca_fusiformis.AAC.2